MYLFVCKIAIRQTAFFTGSSRRPWRTWWPATTACIRHNRSKWTGSDFSHGRRINKVFTIATLKHIEDEPRSVFFPLFLSVSVPLCLSFSVSFFLTCPFPFFRLNMIFNPVKRTRICPHKKKDFKIYISKYNKRTNYKRTIAVLTWKTYVSQNWFTKLKIESINLFWLIMDEIKCYCVHFLKHYFPP